MCISATTALALVGGATAATVLPSILGSKGPSQADMTAQAKSQAKAEQDAANEKAAQDSAAKLASKNRARATSLLATGAPSGSPINTMQTGKTTLGQ